MYEAGQLNLLCVVELFDHALQLLKEHRSRGSPASESRPSPQNLQEKCHQMSRVLQELHLIRYQTGSFDALNFVFYISEKLSVVLRRPFRQKLSKEEIPEIRTSIRELEADWDKRWTETLKETPLVSFLNEDPVSIFL